MPRAGPNLAGGPACSPDPDTSGCRVICTARASVNDPMAAYRTLDGLLVEADVINLDPPRWCRKPCT